jgi:hypothetical protein
LGRLVSVMMNSRHDWSPFVFRSSAWSLSSRITLSCFAITDSVTERLFNGFGTCRDDVAGRL